MSKYGYRYTKEFKNHIMELFYSGNSINYLSSTFQISKMTLYKWNREYKQKDIISNAAVLPEDEEVSKEEELIQEGSPKEDLSKKEDLSNGSLKNQHAEVETSITVTKNMEELINDEIIKTLKESDMHSENEVLRKRITVLENENLTLKKAVAIFAAS